MEAPIKRLKHPIRLAFAVSLALHAAVLALHLVMPPMTPRTVADQASSRLDITLAPPRPPATIPTPPEPVAPPTLTPQPKVKPRPAPPKRILAAPNKEKPSVAQSETPPPENPALKKFLEEIAPPPAPQPPPKPSGTELAQRALAMARGIARQDDSDGAFKESRRANNGRAIDPLAMELYFDAFVRKLNRSAAFVPSEQRGKGADVAVVQVLLNSDGSLKSYRVLTAADQQAEIAYVRNVVERAAPFAAFPPDMRDTIDTLSIEICILPPRAGAGGGAFSRTFGGRDCRDLG